MSTGKPKQPSIVSERLRNHKLSSPTFQQPADVVRWFGAVQAQDFHAAKWALGLRMDQATNAAVEDAFNRGEIVRTHVLRPTWHFVAPEDIRWLLELTAPRVNLRAGPNYRKFELDERVFKRSYRVLTNALKSGKHRTRSELKTALNRAGIPADDTVRMAHILLRAELDGVVCSGPRRGNQFTYALLEERVPEEKSFSRDEALAELTRRYFTSHGPATLVDFVWWSGLTTKDARRGIEVLDRELEHAQIDDTAYWSSTSAIRDANAHQAYLLPVYDEYNVAYKNRQLLVDPGVVSEVTTWASLGPSVVIAGGIVGVWKSVFGKGSVEVEIKPIRSLTRREKLAITKAAERYAAFHGVSLTLTTI